MSTLTVRIHHNAYDGNQSRDACSNWATGGPIQMFQATSPTLMASGWFHFQEVSIPPNSPIQQATFRFMANNDWPANVTPENLYLQVEDHPNPARPINSSQGPCSRTYFGQVQATKWDLVTGETWDEDITPLIQHVVDLPGFASNYVQVLYYAGNSGGIRVLTIRAHDNGPANAAGMIIDYGAEDEPGLATKAKISTHRTGVIRR